MDKSRPVLYETDHEAPPPEAKRISPLAVAPGIVPVWAGGPRPKCFFALRKSFLGASPAGRSPEPQFVWELLTSNPSFARACGYRPRVKDGTRLCADVPACASWGSSTRSCGPAASGTARKPTRSEARSGRASRRGKTSSWATRPITLFRGLPRGMEKLAPHGNLVCAAGAEMEYWGAGAARHSSAAPPGRVRRPGPHVSPTAARVLSRRGQGPGGDRAVPNVAPR